MLVLGLAIGIGVLFFKDLFTTRNEPTPAIREAQMPLKENEIVRVVTTNKTVTIVKKDGTKTRYVPSSGYASTTVEKDGTIKVKVKNKGLGFELGGGLLFADKFRIGVDLQIFYWNRLSTHLGLGLMSDPVAIPYGTVGYKLDQIYLNNTSIIAGITFNVKPVVGIRWEF